MWGTPLSVQVHSGPALHMGDPSKCASTWWASSSYGWPLSVLFWSLAIIKTVFLNHFLNMNFLYFSFFLGVHTWLPSGRCMLISLLIAPCLILSSPHTGCLEGWSRLSHPAVVFSILWEAVRTLHGQAPVSVFLPPSRDLFASSFTDCCCLLLTLSFLLFCILKSISYFN